MFDDDITAYLPEHLRPFAQQLRQFPAGYEKWLFAPSLPSDVYQGDLFDLVPFAGIDDNGEAVHYRGHGMVISNTCDAQPDRSDFVLLAPVIDLEDYREHNGLQGEALENHIRDLTENKISQLMYIPESHWARGSFVDFGSITSASLRFFYSQ